MMLVIAVSALALPGCSGCRQDPDERLAEKIKREKERQKKKKPKPNFRSPGTAILPGKFPDLKSLTTAELKEMKEIERRAYLRNQFTRLNRTKLGHWVETSTPTIANNFDQKGQINSLLYQGSAPALVPGTEFEFGTTRSFSLVRGRWKYLPSTAYLPANGNSVSANLNVGLSTSNDGLPFYTVPISSSQTMKGFQYHIVVLTSRPQQLRYLQFADSIRISQSRDTIYESPPFYYVVTNQAGNPIPLPRSVLNWTTTAYLIWDDLDPDDLDPDQQQALVDWLHFGGQLILSGPDCLSKLENSFLADYLPAQAEGKTEYGAAAFEDLNENWSVPNRLNAADRRSLLVTDQRKLVGVEFKPHVKANYIAGTGELTIERTIGRGRVVATAFSLTSPTVKSWGSFQSFLNNALLRKPRRKFGSQNETVLFDWVNDSTSMFEPLIGSNVRFISRDLGSSGTSRNFEDEISLRQARKLEDPFSGEPTEITPHNLQRTGGRNTKNTRHYGGFKANSVSGVGGWSDDSAISQAARAGLKSAAGITPPSASLILKMLLVYLLVLVPANWLLFRAIGKVEWAWAAIPIISIAGAITVVKIASLDIGFARSNTQVALLEVHDGYHRGHLSQYSALYTSLSTNYAVELDNASGIALPLGSKNDSSVASNEVERKRLTFNQSLTNRTENLQIQSNSTGLLHAEWFQDLGGDFRLQFSNEKLKAESEPEDTEAEPDSVFDPEEKDFANFSIQNLTALDLTSAGVIARDLEGNYLTGWIGDLTAQNQRVQVTLETSSRADLPKLWAGEAGLVSLRESPQQLMARFKLEDGDRISMPQIREQPLLEKYLPMLEEKAEPFEGSDELSISRNDFLSTIAKEGRNESGSLVGNLLQVVLNNLELGKGEVRLLGVNRNQIGNTRFDPESTQTQSETLIVAHLRHPDLPPAARDVNSILDFTTARTTLTDQAEREAEEDFSDDVFDGTLDE